MQWLNDWLNWFWEHLKDFLLYLPKWCWQHLLEGLTAVVNAIPVPEAFGDFASAVSNFSGPVLWFLTLLQVPFGLTVISAAMLARFLLRRIPLIG